MSIEMDELRRIRNKKLAECDWTQGNDCQLLDSKKTEWKTYRQALRDITKTAKPKLGENSPFLDPSSVTFPTKPS